MPAAETGLGVSALRKPGAGEIGGALRMARAPRRRGNSSRLGVTASCRHVSGGGHLRRRSENSVAINAKVVPWQLGQRSVGVAGSSAVSSR